MIISSIFSLFFIILSPGFVGSCFQTSTTPGDLWLKLGCETNQLYISGFVIGFDFGVRSIISDLEKAGDIKIDEEIEKMIHERSVLGTNCYQICEGIDEIYKDYSNRHIKPAGLILIVCDKINGKINKAEFEKELQRLRTVFE